MKPTPPPPHPVLLRSLGQADVLVGGQSVHWPARSAEELLWYLHAHPEGATRADILAHLWDQDDTPSSANRFRVALHRVRSALRRPDAIQDTRGRYALAPDLIAQSDTHALHHALNAARHAPTHREREDLLRQALASSEGEYLPHLRGDWVEQARARHRAALIEAQLTLSQLHCETRDCPLSAQALARAAETDPLIGEDHHQRLMVCLAMTRDRYAAVEHYRRYRHFLAREVGDTPMPDTVSLAERLKTGERPCAKERFTPSGRHTPR